MNCTIHLEKEASGACVHCGKFFCSDCLVDINGKNYCREHVSNAVSDHAATLQQPNIIINNANNNANTNNNINSGDSAFVSPKSRLVSLLLCLFIGVFGIHRFYVGKIGTGIIWLFTFGFFGIGALFDFIMILLGSFRDSYGRPIKNW